MFQSLLVDLAKQFDSHAIPYMVIGGQAVLLYGEPRLTRDIDITLGVDNTSLGVVVALTEKIKLKPAVENVSEFVGTSNVLPLIDQATHIRIDLIFSFTPYERQAMERVQTIHVEQYPVRYASLEDIIIHKIFAGRPRDIEDVKGILARNAVYDSTYIHKWLKEFSSALGKDFTALFQEIVGN